MARRVHDMCVCVCARVCMCGSVYACVRTCARVSVISGLSIR